MKPVIKFADFKDITTDGSGIIDTYYRVYLDYNLYVELSDDRGWYSVLYKDFKNSLAEWLNEIRPRLKYIEFIFKHKKRYSLKCCMLTKWVIWDC